MRKAGVGGQVVYFSGVSLRFALASLKVEPDPVLAAVVVAIIV